MQNVCAFFSYIQNLLNIYLEYRRIELIRYVGVDNFTLVIIFDIQFVEYV